MQNSVVNSVIFNIHGVTEKKNRSVTKQFMKNDTILERFDQTRRYCLYFYGFVPLFRQR